MEIKWLAINIGVSVLLTLLSNPSGKIQDNIVQAADRTATSITLVYFLREELMKKKKQS
jgi:hypothetical protein